MRAFLQALVLLLVVHLFVARWVTVQSTSMYATLKPDDLLLVWRWPKWTGVERNDVVVFRDPMRDDLDKSGRSLLVKRIIGMPGDIVLIDKGVVSVNGVVEILPRTVTHRYLVRLKENTTQVALLKDLELPLGSVQNGRSFIELPLNEAMAQQVQEHPDVLNVEPMSTATGAPRHIFPFDPRYSWNSDNYGPIAVPRKGDTININVVNLPLYDRLMSQYEGHKLRVDNDSVLIDGTPLKTYVIEKNYYFVLGDARHNSSDSRYWGFLPADHIVGRAGPVLYHHSRR